MCSGCRCLCLLCLLNPRTGLSQSWCRRETETLRLLPASQGSVSSWSKDQLQAELCLRALGGWSKGTTEDPLALELTLKGWEVFQLADGV